MKILDEINKNYKKINIIFLCITIYFFSFPLFSRILEAISPNLTKCIYLQTTGKPCPLCGGTRFIKSIDNVLIDISYVFNFFGILVAILILELIFRTINIFAKKYNPKLIKTDIIIHIILFISYIMYAIWFINKK